MMIRPSGAVDVMLYAVPVFPRRMGTAICLLPFCVSRLDLFFPDEFLALRTPFSICASGRRPFFTPLASDVRVVAFGVHGLFQNSFKYRDKEGCRNFLNALASICRILSFVTDS